MQIHVDVLCARCEITTLFNQLIYNLTIHVTRTTKKGLAGITTVRDHLGMHQGYSESVGKADHLAEGLWKGNCGQFLELSGPMLTAQCVALIAIC